MRRLLLLVLLVLLVSGCASGGAPAAKRSTTRSPSPSATTSQAPDPPPQVGQCYQLTYDAATSPTTDVPAVPCSQAHTAVTIYVGRIDPVVDGHLLTVDSATVQTQIAQTCPTKVGGWVGGDQDTQRLSRFTSIWFSPSLTQADRGADWFRCDLVAVRGADDLATLATTKNVLSDADRGLDRYGICGNSAPSAKRFSRIICAQPHQWQAVKVVAIAADAAYLGAKAQAAADDSCKVEAQQRATDPLVYKWSFEWPTKHEWDDGQRYGLCWVPAT
ncbi:hypothetical protein D9V37_06485 [Nocardioides mangrovicus]|uniref:Septum formation-related domain-containing protein n=1 Tax=Nocardioides mangrovicus TaxID=2478913 RepID=A0A3L8P5A0_9ACTN|nr:septum formation family protein [Nocardioides mangrovicus]RLV49568.1 hypothetical protein D9V37_06485 [Nocardioides mangrovicus]